MASLTRPLWSPYAAVVCDVNALSLVGAILLVKQLEVVEQEGPDQGDERLVLFSYQNSHYVLAVAAAPRQSCRPRCYRWAAPSWQYLAWYQIKLDILYSCSL